MADKTGSPDILGHVRDAHSAATPGQSQPTPVKPWDIKPFPPGYKPTWTDPRGKAARVGQDPTQGKARKP